MKVEIQNPKKHCTSCNFCDKGELNSNQDDLNYPYKRVYVFQNEGNGVKAAICDGCLEELNQKVKSLNKSN